MLARSPAWSAIVLMISFRSSASMPTSPPPLRSSENPTTAARGVRSSWETVATNRSLAVIRAPAFSRPILD